MSDEPGAVEASAWEYLIGGLILVGTLLSLAYLLPTPIVVFGGVVIALSLTVYGAVFLLVRYEEWVPDWLRAVPIWLMFLIPALIAGYLILRFDLRFSVINGLIFLALLLLIFVYWLVIPSAILHQLRTGDDHEVTEWPALTILIPAHNEEGSVGSCIASLLSSRYPSERMQIVVIDDGSTDGTYEEAARFAGPDVTVYRKEQGGKHSALNYGLARTESELVVSIDADSTVATTALQELVATYLAHPSAAAVAGNVKVGNRTSFVTRMQALEYIVSINMYRRALDLLGLVKVVPGCLGLFERDEVEAAGGFSGDTVTEDFDLTIALHKQGNSIHYASRAIVRTEAPGTLAALYDQRLRWLRGTVQTVRKHREILFSPRFGMLHRVLVPYLVLSIAFVPFLGVVVLGTIAWMVLFGSIVEFLGILVIFVTLELLFATLAISIENSVEPEDFTLVRYSPLLVVGYKQFHDVIMIKSIYDVFTKPDLSWSRTEEASQEAEPLPAEGEAHPREGG